LPRVELMEKTRSVGRKIGSVPDRVSTRLEAPRAAIERGRSNPLLGIAAVMGALVLIAWIAWAIYVTDDNGANAGLGVVLSWPVLLAALALVASPFVGLYLLVRLLRQRDEAGQSPSISGGSADAEAETEEKPAGESEDEASDEKEDEDEDELDEDAEEPEEDAEEPEETDPDEEPPSGEKETSVSD
jgi:hypothetical protein